MRNCKPFLVGIALLAASCAGPGKALSGLQNQFVGRNADEFFLRLGPPSEVFQLNNGDKLITWVGGSASVNMPTTTTITGSSYSPSYSGTSYYSGHAYTSGGGTVHMECRLRLLVSPSGTIKELTIDRDTIGAWKSSRCAEVLEAFEQYAPEEQEEGAEAVADVVERDETPNAPAGVNESSAEPEPTFAVHESEQRSRSTTAAPRVAPDSPAVVVAPRAETAELPFAPHITVPTVELYDVHLALSKAGFNTGGEWKTYGPKTTEAVRRFQKAKGVPVTGNVDEATWRVLLNYR